MLNKRLRRERKKLNLNLVETDRKIDFNVETDENGANNHEEFNGDINKSHITCDNDPQRDKMVSENTFKLKFSSKHIMESTFKCVEMQQNMITRSKSPNINAIIKLNDEVKPAIVHTRKCRLNNNDERKTNGFSVAEATEGPINGLTVTFNPVVPAANLPSKCKRIYSNRLKRTRHCSSTASEHDGSVTYCRKNKVKKYSYLTTPDCYYTQASDKPILHDVVTDAEVEARRQQMALEVPSWRVKSFTSCYALEGTENLDDEVFLKRHSRLEIDERRRKRWDIQRIREIRQIERLKSRQERTPVAVSQEKIKNDPFANLPASMWPSLDDLKFVEITDNLPVCAFGYPIPQLEQSEFTLPWTNKAPNKTPEARMTVASPVMSSAVASPVMTSAETPPNEDVISNDLNSRKRKFIGKLRIRRTAKRRNLYTSQLVQ